MKLRSLSSKSLKSMRSRKSGDKFSHIPPAPAPPSVPSIPKSKSHSASLSNQLKPQINGSGSTTAPIPPSATFGESSTLPKQRLNEFKTHRAPPHRHLLPLTNLVHLHNKHLQILLLHTMSTKFNKPNIKKHNRDYVNKRLKKLKNYKDNAKRVNNNNNNNQTPILLVLMLHQMVLHLSLSQLKTIQWP